MNRLSVDRSIALLVLAASVVALSLSLGAARERVRTEDRDGDGRPDVWHRYDDRGLEIEVDIDSNFDGRPDILEYYDHGRLVRRETDRNFNDQVDLVEEFDSVTEQRVRSIVDLDFDGTADLLVLFRDGRPVFSKRASGPAARRGPNEDLARRIARAVAPGRARRGLAPLVDPFQADLALRTWPTSPVRARLAGLIASGGLPVPYGRIVALAQSARFLARGSALVDHAFACGSTPRAPPLA